MESQPQDIVASGSPAEVPNDPGYVVFSSQNYYYLNLLRECFFKYLVMCFLLL